MAKEKVKVEEVMIEEAVEAVVESSPSDIAVEAWVVKHIHSMSFRTDTKEFNHFRQAVEALKASLNELRK